MFSYDELYGIDIIEYCKAHDTTLEALIEKTKKDIQLLNDNMGKALRMKLPYEKNHLPDTIFALIKKKRDHVEHLKDWQNKKNKQR